MPLISELYDDALFDKAKPAELQKAHTISLYINYTDMLGDRWTATVDMGDESGTHAKIKVYDHEDEFVANLSVEFTRPAFYAKVLEGWQRIESELEELWG
jgi:hypothetical protein